MPDILLKELRAENAKQAAEISRLESLAEAIDTRCGEEISRLREVIAKCEYALKHFYGLGYVDEALAAIKESEK